MYLLYGSASCQDLRFNPFIFLILGDDMIKLHKTNSVADVVTKQSVPTSPLKSK